jgi:hypothetical protein
MRPASAEGIGGSPWQAPHFADRYAATSHGKPEADALEGAAPAPAGALDAEPPFAPTDCVDVVFPAPLNEMESPPLPPSPPWAVSWTMMTSLPGDEPEQAMATLPNATQAIPRLANLFITRSLSSQERARCYAMAGAIAESPFQGASG